MVIVDPIPYTVPVVPSGLVEEYSLSVITICGF